MNVEAATGSVPELAWFKSSYSGAEGGQCVEVAACPEAVHVRDSKDKGGPILSFTSEGWAAFVKFSTQD
ncbi:DUF397 domain-containing protein [Streptomyces sp. S1A1-8]|uniref:DUF397 domain-containing protein n=1 Tax=unclassified Streptomyces TaxID=2593676 RepID=UPI00116484BF|nr:MULTISPECIES: DUF397 domain-containing protein [unclassified Streptomyces]QDN77364.1 DUF397 domain-containing protein [Streptomyces sp. S1A1-7]QDN97726.1 DUF397 domain-containing protein [Streptomyces sp. RLB1-9]QDO19433.1 DUF397 domain-containing protein [Streptomyces sp. S1A1-8]QDO29559.1 DUF397 domain-containing protein [Streptomyces sp. S1A1-3]